MSGWLLAVVVAGVALRTYSRNGGESATDALSRLDI